MSKKTSERPLDKFQAFRLFRDNPNAEKVKPYATIPHFFFSMWFEYRELPPSFWTTLFFILRQTIGRTAEGREGTLAIRDIPVEKTVASKWVNAIAGYAKLCQVEFADYDSEKGSKFILNPDATEDDWEGFFRLLTVGWREGMFGAGGKKASEIRSEFAQFNKKPRMPCWSGMILRCVVDLPKDHPDYDKFFGFDLWDSVNWRQRGFDVMWIHPPDESGAWHPRKEFEGLPDEMRGPLTFWLHFAWLNAEQNDDVPCFPVERDIWDMYSFANDPPDPTPFIARLEQRSDESGDWLELPTFTKLYQQAKHLALLDENLDPALLQDWPEWPKRGR